MIRILGLGPGDPLLVTRRVWEALSTASEVYVTDPTHPALPPGRAWQLLDEPDALAQAVQLGGRPQGLTLALAGNPAAHPLGRRIIERASAEGMEVQIESGVVEAPLPVAAFAPEAWSRFFVISAQALHGGHMPPFPPNTPALITGLEQPEATAVVQRMLSSIYPPDHRLTLVEQGPSASAVLHSLPLADLTAQARPVGPAAVFVPPMAYETAFEAFAEVVAHLRAPEDGCPWDKAQTHLSLRADLLEEVYELLSAIDQGHPDGMREELGDVLLHVLLQPQIAADAGEFTLADVLASVYTKIVGRHPHVFGEAVAAGVQGVLQNWEKLKAQERAAQGKPQNSILDGINLALPALVQAQQFQKRAARVGFDWPDVQGVLDKLQEELQEVSAASNGSEREDEIGDVLFVIANLARWYEVDAEAALRQANAKFQRRFARIEAGARAQARELSSLSLEEMDALWNEAKEQGL
jgi:tetrapyrrole methylase family protein/MazG family protein